MLQRSFLHDPQFTVFPGLRATLCDGALLDETSSLHMLERVCAYVCVHISERQKESLYVFMRACVWVCVCGEGGKTLLSFVFVMITHGGITPLATRWSLSV